eukprot:gb/GECH01011180.1/.p1 GENE.gb/GECH01011180.1/~~gb/GECH01011180.1/.p1  ORF type:complete len:196 (+),score=18.57 gb/GECH01011180.1/:1-588(+)
MGVDLVAGGRNKKNKRTAPKSNDIYLRLLARLYSYLSRKTHSKFCRTVHKRLCQSRITRRPISIGKIGSAMKNYKEGDIAVVVGPVLNDDRVFFPPKNLRVCALSFSETARRRILENGGEVMTFDQLAMVSPVGKGAVLLRGPRNSRKALKYMGKAPGLPGSHTRPRIIGGKKSGKKVHENARGRRASRGYKRKA